MARKGKTVTRRLGQNGRFTKSEDGRAVEVRIRPATPGSPIGDVLAGLMREKGMTLRDLEELTRKDDHPGYVSHQYLSRIIRGLQEPREDTLSRLLTPFGYRAVREMRLEPIEENDHAS